MGEMMQSCIDKLLEICSAGLCPPLHEQRAGSARRSEFAALCRQKNGFYAFESALHVFPTGSDACGHTTAEQWNANGHWKDCYAAAADDIWCFAEDLFGGQFGFRGEQVVSFNPESAEVATLAGTLEEWACRLLTDYEFLTWYPVAHEWQAKFGPLHAGMRLAPKTPFILGGEYAVDNLYALDAVEGMRLRGDLYRQMRHLPDGSRVAIKVER